MFYRFTLALLTMMLLALTLSGQHKKFTSFGFKGGLNRSVINGKELDGTATGYIGLEMYAALFADTELKEKWRFENELLFSFTDEYFYLEIPLHVKYRVIEKTFILAGPKIDILLNDDEAYDDSHHFGMSVECGVQYEITKRIIAEGRYAQGLLRQINDSSFDIYNGKRNTLRLGFGFRF